MAPARDVLLFLLILGILLCATHGNNQLSYEFYDKSCPGIERLVRETIAPLFVADPTAPAALLRLMFHDCQVQQQQYWELIRQHDKGDGLRQELRHKGKQDHRAVEISSRNAVPGAVSCADLLVLAARDAVALSGGPALKALLGRRDAHTSSLQLADALLPPPTLGVDGMLKIFSAMDMDVPESVAILGNSNLSSILYFSIDAPSSKP